MFLKFLDNMQGTHVLRFVAISRSQSLHFYHSFLPWSSTYSLLLEYLIPWRIFIMCSSWPSVLRAPPVVLLQHWKVIQKMSLKCTYFWFFVWNSTKTRSHLIVQLPQYFSTQSQPQLMHLLCSGMNCSIPCSFQSMFSVIIHHVITVSTSQPSFSFWLQRFCFSSNTGNSQLATYISGIITIIVGVAVMKLSAVSVYFLTKFCGWNFCYLFPSFSVQVLSCIQCKLNTFYIKFPQLPKLSEFLHMTLQNYRFVW